MQCSCSSTQLTPLGIQASYTDEKGEEIGELGIIKCNDCGKQSTCSVTYYEFLKKVNPY